MFREGLQLLLPSMTATQAVEVVVDGDALVGACASGGFDAVVFETVDVSWNVEEMLSDVRRLLGQPVLIGTYPSQHHRPGPVEGVALVCRTGSCRAVARALDGLPAAEVHGTKANPGPSNYESHPLTRREFQVLALISGGSTTAQIADRLGLSAKTVESRMQTLYSKLNVQNRSSAIAVAMGSGLLGVGPGAHGAP